MKILVIGAGPSGVIASLKLQDKYDVTLMDANNKTLKKLLLTGNGKCNYWNSEIKSDKYVCDDKNILNKILFNKDETYEYLYNLGIYPIIKNNLYYPYSESASSIKTILDNSLYNASLKLDEKVINISKIGSYFKVETSKNTYEFDKVIISCGGCSYPKTGSDGSIYSIIENLGHNVEKNIPSLTSLEVKEGIKDLEGLRIGAVASLYIDDKKVKEEQGEVQFTKDSLSGICIFNLSTIASKAIDEGKNVKIKLNLFKSDFNKFIKERDFLDTFDKKVESIFNYKMINYLKKISNSENEFIDNVNNLEFNITGVGDFEKSQTTLGGVLLSNINPDNMESLIVPGLYFTGEVLNVCGICGGFNLAFAFITGFIAGDNL